jgi:hypothetical protein
MDKYLGEACLACQYALGAEKQASAGEAGALETILASGTALNAERPVTDAKARDCGCYVWLRNACSMMNPTGSGCD